ncbi:MAG TPA: hypothetical protein VIN09_12690, partial [Chloroflexota bacterium]
MRRYLPFVVVSLVVAMAVVFSSPPPPDVSAQSTGAGVEVFDQCENGGPPSPNTGCVEWTNGALNSTNSHYAEDDVVPQRLVLSLPAGGATTGRTVTIEYQTLKGGKHAYDSLATWNYTQTTADRCQDLAPANCPSGDPSTFTIPSDAPGHELPEADRKMTMYGGTITNVEALGHTPSGG